MTDEFSLSQKLLQGLVSHELTAYLSVFDIFLTQWIMAILSKSCKLHNFKPHSALKLSVTNIQGLHPNFVECESFFEWNSSDILALYETNLDDSVDSDNFSLRAYLPLIWKNSITDMRDLAVYVKYGLPLAQDLPLEISTYSYLCFRLALLHSVSYFFFLNQFPS